MRVDANFPPRNRGELAPARLERSLLQASRRCGAHGDDVLRRRKEATMTRRNRSSRTPNAAKRRRRHRLSLDRNEVPAPITVSSRDMFVLAEVAARSPEASRLRS